VLREKINSRKIKVYLGMSMAPEEKKKKDDKKKKEDKPKKDEKKKKDDKKKKE
jgi:hypothetical protein